MTGKGNNKRIWTDLLVALAISIVINISYFIFLFGPIQLPTGRGGSTVTSDLNYINLIIQVGFYFIQAFILIKIASINTLKPLNLWKRLLICVIVSVLFYCLTPYFNREGSLNILILGRRLMNPMTILKTSFTFIVSVLYAQIINLVYQRQNIIIENQQLKTENLQSRYTTLVSQINPHFFFNSLNSLAMLIRGNHNEDALKYTDQLSDTFRYIIQNGEKGMVTLDEEVGFLDSYKYLFEIRYANKLFFDLSIDEKYKTSLIPSLSIQPLIENAVKHNSITSSNPLVISISTLNDSLIISNPIHPKIEQEPGTRVGLKNLSNRYLLLTDKEIEVINDGKTFSVRLPLSNEK